MIGSTVSFKDRKDKWDIDIKQMQQTIGHNFIGISTATNIFPNYVLQQILNMQINSQFPSNNPKQVKRNVKLDDEFRKQVEKQYNKKQIKEETTPKRSKKKEKQANSKKKCINLAELANKVDIQCNRSNKKEIPAVQNQQNQCYTYKLERAQARIVQLQKDKQMLANKNKVYLKENQQLTIKITSLKEEYRLNQFDKQNLVTLINQINSRREQGLVDQVQEIKQAKSNEEYCKILQKKCIQLLEENERICQIYKKTEQQSNMLKQKVIDYQKQLAKNKIQYETKRNEMDKLQKSNKMSSDSTAVMIKTLQQTLVLKQNELDYHIKQKQNEIKKLQEQLCKLNEQMSKIKADSNNSKSESMKKIQQIQSLHVVLASKEEKINSLNQQLKRLIQFDLKQRQAEIGRLNLVCKQQGSKIEQLTQIADNCRKMEERLRSMECIKMENEVNLKKSQAQFQRLRNQLIRCRQESELKMNELILLKCKQIQGIKSAYSLTQMQQKTKIAAQSIQISQISKKNNELLTQIEQAHQRQKRSESYMTQLQVELKKRDQEIRKWQQQVIEQQRLMKNKMQIVGRTNHTDRHQLQESIKFLTQEVEIWSKKYENLIQENGNLKNKLQSYVGMYEIMAKKVNSAESSANNSFISVTSQKQYRQLIRQLQSSKVELQVMKQQKQQIESTLNKQLNKRKQIIESLIKDRKQSYTPHTSS